MSDNDTKKFEKKLTIKDIQAEIDKIENFFEQIPEDLKTEAAIHFIFEIANWGTSNYFESLGILEEVKNRYREIYFEAISKENEDKDEDKEE